MKTLLLDVTEWDLVLDASGNIACAELPYAAAQDVASALRLFLGELWYNTRAGVPYLQELLGHVPPVSLFREYLETAAKTVPGVVEATCTIERFENRTVQGQVLFTMADGQTGVVNL